MKGKDFLRFFVVLLAAGFVTSLIQSYVPTFASLGIVGTLLSSAILSVPSYLLLKRFWKRRS